MKKSIQKILLSVALIIALGLSAQELMAFSFNDSKASAKKSCNINLKRNVIGKRGCCSWHKGVCGCNHDGRTKYVVMEL